MIMNQVFEWDTLLHHVGKKQPLRASWVLWEPARAAFPPAAADTDASSTPPGQPDQGSTGPPARHAPRADWYSVGGRFGWAWRRTALCRWYWPPSSVPTHSAGDCSFHRAYYLTCWPQLKSSSSASFSHILLDLPSYPHLQTPCVAFSPSPLGRSFDVPPQRHRYTQTSSHHSHRDGHSTWKKGKKPV